MRAAFFSGLIGLYFFIATLHTFWYFSVSRYICVQSVGFMQGFFWGCDRLSLSPLDRVRYDSFYQSLFKGMIWPYTHLANNDDDLDIIAKDLVEHLNKFKGEGDEFSTFIEARHIANEIEIKYVLDKRVWDKINSLPINETDEMFRRGFCTNLKSDKQSVLSIIEGGYRINLKYSSIEQNYSKTVLILDCKLQKSS